MSIEGLFSSKILHIMDLIRSQGKPVSALPTLVFFIFMDIIHCADILEKQG